MQQPIQVTFKDVDHSASVEEHVREKAEKLNQFNQDIISCHITLDLQQKKQNQGNLYTVHITTSVPGKEFVASHNGDENMYIAIRDAFDNMRDQLKEHTHQLHGKVKTHTEHLNGKVARLFDYDEFGFIHDEDGNEYYFNAGYMNSHSFDSLKIGQSVHFTPDVGREGAVAKKITVRRGRD